MKNYNIYQKLEDASLSLGDLSSYLKATPNELHCILQSRVLKPVEAAVLERIITHLRQELSSYPDIRIPSEDYYSHNTSGLLATDYEYPKIVGEINFHRYDAGGTPMGVISEPSIFNNLDVTSRHFKNGVCYEDIAALLHTTEEEFLTTLRNRELTHNQKEILYELIYTLCRIIARIEDELDGDYPDGTNTERGNS